MSEQKNNWTIRRIITAVLLVIAIILIFWWINNTRHNELPTQETVTLEHKTPNCKKIADLDYNITASHCSLLNNACYCFEPAIHNCVNWDERTYSKTCLEYETIGEDKMLRFEMK